MPPDSGGGTRHRQVADHRQLAGRVRHHRQNPFPLGEPLAVDFDVEDDHRHGEEPPQDVAARGVERGGLEEEQPRNPWSEEVVHADVVEELAFHQGEAEKASEEIQDGEDDQYDETKRP